MKSMILITLIFTSEINAQRICSDYIPDDWPDSRYNVTTRSDDVIVIDKDTGLMWKHCVEGLFGTNCEEGDTNLYNWSEAFENASVINNSAGYAGYNDWRLPSIKEFNTLVTRNCHSPSINDTIFPKTPSEWFWSSSPLVNGNGSWILVFDYGFESSLNNRVANGYMRLVRDVPQD